MGVVAKERITLGRDGVVVGRNPRPQMQVSWDHLYVAVRAAVADGSYHLGRAAVGAGQDASDAWLELADGTRILGDLVIGADGVGSAVRRSFLPVDRGPRYAGYVAWRALVPESRLTAAAAHALSDRFAFFHTHGGQALGYTVAGAAGELHPGERRYNAVWYRTVADLGEALTDRQGRRQPLSLPPASVSDTAKTALISEARELLPPPFADVFEAEPEPFVQAIVDMETVRMVHGRIALIGDAAFVARPHTAMGVAKAAGDAMAMMPAVALGWTSQASGTFETERMEAGRTSVALGVRLGASMA